MTLPNDLRSSNEDLIARRARAAPRGVSMAAPISVAHAENAELWDVEGRRYIDFTSGIGVVNTGHRHPAVVAAAMAQLQSYIHTCFMVVPYEPYVALAEALNQLAPIEGPAKTLLVTTGAEAVENAIKIARAATGRTDVIAFAGAFHGRTLLTLGLTGKATPYKTGFGPFPAGLWRSVFPDPIAGVSSEQALTALRMLFEVEVPAERVAAIIVEPVQGEGGFNVAPPEFLRGLREVCDEHGVMLIADEVQSGFGRTGKWFAIEHAGVAPDLITTAKGIGGGLPLAGVTGRAEVMDAPIPGGLGGTFGGNPVSCAAGLAVIETIQREGLLDRAARQGDRVKHRLGEAAAASAGIAGIRGLGAMIAFDVLDADGAPDPDGARGLTTRCREAGLLILTAGRIGHTVRLLPPLTTPDEILDEGLEILAAAISALSARSGR